jgi:3-deoxy-D-manno-octulosonic-acid transferase
VALIGRALWRLWQLVGLLVLPLLLLHPAARRHILRIPTPEPGWSWLHGASAGEHRAALGLIGALSGPVWRTRSSWRTPVPGTFPAPLDLPFVIGPWLDRARPSRLILIEAELWPGWILACRARGIPVAVVNARPSRGTERLKRLGRLWEWLIRDVTFISQQETGDLKLAAAPPPPPFSLPRPALIGASTRPGDEARLITAWQTLPAPRPLLVLAPRHLHRIPEVLALLDEAGISHALRSTAPDPSQPNTQVLVLDTLGELAGLFSEADAAFIGGTFSAAIGGHSPAEAFACGLPVACGPHTAANPAAWSVGRAFPAEPSLAVALAAALSAGRQPTPTTATAAAVAARLPEGHPPPPSPQRPLLAPLQPLWLLIGRRLPAYAAAPIRLSVPVVSVGALSAGGSGKTPAVAWLASRLEGAWVVARGYRRPGGGREVRLDGPLGDELELLRRRGVPVVSAPDRVAGAQAAIAAGARLILLDDGFQHRRLARDLDIVCIDGRWPDGRGLIPVGSGREPWSALSRAHWIWHSHPQHPLPHPTTLPTVEAGYRAVGWLRRGERLPLSALPPGPHPAATGIARPEGFLSMLVALDITISDWRTVRDHGALGVIVPGTLVTEKDAARLPPEADVWALVIELSVEGGEALLDAIRGLSC